MRSTPTSWRNRCRPLRTVIANSYRPWPRITIDEDKLMAQVGEPQEYRTCYDPDDGSVVDW